jgi:hypothetical protein
VNRVKKPNPKPPNPDPNPNPNPNLNPNLNLKLSQDWAAQNYYELEYLGQRFNLLFWVRLSSFGSG